MIRLLIKMLLAYCLVVSSNVLATPAKPDLLLAQVYQNNIDVQQYWVSEKLDGIRAYWDGSKLISRGGNIIAAPAWFTAGFPRQPLDGELWLGRNKFADTLSIVSKSVPVDSEWQHIGYYIFELPHAAGSFSQRVTAMQQLVLQQNNPYLKQVVQFRLGSNAELMAKLQQLEQSGAEGLMLHRQDAAYTTGRDAALLKLKTYQDTEAEVIGYRPGKGKYQGMVGALVVKMPDGKTFAIGSGLTDALRQTPPEIGSIITYRYNGETKHGLPRFARFLRVHQPF